MKRIFFFLLITVALCNCNYLNQSGNSENDRYLELGFINPPQSALTWVLWDWISNNVTREGITQDLESFKRIGVGGVVWRGLSGPWWAPEGPVGSDSLQFNSLMQWAISEAERLDIVFDMSIDFGYGSGGAHITPDLSMQQLYWSHIIVDGGKMIDTVLPRAEVDKEGHATGYHGKGVSQAWLRPGEKLIDKVQEDIENIDSYRDVAVMAIPYSNAIQEYQIPDFELRTGLNHRTYYLHLDELSPPENAVIPMDGIIHLTNLMNPDGTLSWDAPEGKWKIIRLGHGSNFKMTRPSPTHAIGLECDRLSRIGIDTHFEKFLKPIFEAAGPRAGKTLKYIFLDSWEAGPQNWTAEMPEEFLARRGYKIDPWLPALMGMVVDNPELTERFLWDFRKTVSEMVFDNYIERLRELASPYGIQFSSEGYAQYLCQDNIKWPEMLDYPIAEFWTLTKPGIGHLNSAEGKDRFPYFGKQLYYKTMKVAASAAHTTNKTLVGAEAFTSSRGWADHPYIFKGMGDEAFCQGVNQFILHLSAHQPYEKMIPGLTHRRWGGHFNRNNTWWDYSKPWFDYLARSQYMLQQGHFVADVVYFFGEGAPLHVTDMSLDLPDGYDYDVCSYDILSQMQVRNDKIVLPSGMTYRYLLLPNTDRLTLPTMKKIEELVNSGARIVAPRRVVGTTGLSGYPKDDEAVNLIFSRLWDAGQVIKESDWNTMFQKDVIPPDFSGTGLNYIHRKTNDADIYFVANPEPAVVETTCSFRMSGKIPELWNPETGEIQEITEYEESGGQVSVLLRFEPMQSWFLVFRKSRSAVKQEVRNFPEYLTVKEIAGPWQVVFDSLWGGPTAPATFNSLEDWSTRNEKEIRYYSGMAAYSKTFNLTSSERSESTPVFLDLGQVEVIGKVIVNGKDCGIAWKPPYRVDIAHAVHPGENILEIQVVNTWVNRMIGDENLPEDSNWIDWEVLKEWPEWFMKGQPSPSGRYTFTTARHYSKDDPLQKSGLIGPVRLVKQVFKDADI